MKSAAEKAKAATQRMNLVSPSFCLVRWRHATLNLATGASKSCCHHPYKSLDLSGRHSQLHDNQEEKMRRQEMLDKNRPSDCSTCWSAEDQGHFSDRQNWASMSWMEPTLDGTIENLNAEAQTPAWLELNFSSACNLKCIYCSPIFSTAWYKEIKEFGSYPTSIRHNAIEGLNHVEYEDNYQNQELLKKFWPWFEDILPNLRMLKITGGEPLLSPQTFHMLDVLSQAKYPKTILGINTNLSVKASTWKPFLQAIQKLEQNSSLRRMELHPSIDTYGASAEYIRSGLDWQLFTQNLEEFLSTTRGHVHITCTVNNLALPGLENLLSYILDLKKKYFHPDREIAINPSVLQSPHWLRPQVAPKSVLKKLDQAIRFAERNADDYGRGFTRSEITELEKIRSAARAPSENLKSQKSDLVRFLDEIDRRRKMSAKDTFPEFARFFSEGRRLSRNSSQQSFVHRQWTQFKKIFGDKVV